MPCGVSVSEETLCTCPLLLGENEGTWQWKEGPLPRACPSSATDKAARHVFSRSYPLPNTRQNGLRPILSKGPPLGTEGSAAHEGHRADRTTSGVKILKPRR